MLVRRRSTARTRRRLLLLAAILSRCEHSRAGAPLLVSTGHVPALFSPVAMLDSMYGVGCCFAGRSMPSVDPRCRRMLPLPLELHTA